MNSNLTGTKVLFYDKLINITTQKEMIIIVYERKNKLGQYCVFTLLQYDSVALHNADALSEEKKNTSQRRFLNFTQMV